MIDLHIHILPGLDDGAVDMAQALEMARKASADGIREVIATPHSYGERGFYEALPEEIRRGVTNLQSELDREAIDLRVHTGMEVLLNPETLDYLRRGWLLPLADSDCLLCEFAGEDIHTMTQRLSEVASMGYRPIVAHAERYAPLWKSDAPILDWMKKGWYLQINSAHLTFEPKGFWERRSMQGRMSRAAWNMLRTGAVFAVATDSHGTYGRPPILSKAKDAIARRIDPETAERLCVENPKSLIKG